MPLTLVLPRNKYEHHFLIGGTVDQPVAICFAEDHKFRAFLSAGNDAHKGILIPNVMIEVDPTSVVDASSSGVSLGVVVRHGTNLGIMAMLDGAGFKGFSAQVVPLISDLTSAPDGHGAGFQRWAVTLGAGDSRRVLYKVDLTEPGVEAREGR